MLEINKKQLSNIKFGQFNKQEKKIKKIMKLLNMVVSTSDYLLCKVTFVSNNHGTLQLNSIVIGFTKKYILLKGGSYIPLKSVKDIALA